MGISGNLVINKCAWLPGPKTKLQGCQDQRLCCARVQILEFSWFREFCKTDCYLEMRKVKFCSLAESSALLIITTVLRYST